MQKQKREIKRPTQKMQVRPSAPSNNSGGVIAMLQEQYKKVESALTTLAGKKTVRRSSVPNPEIVALQAQLKEIGNKIQTVTAENDNFKKDAEYRRLAQEKLDKDKHNAKIDNRINEMIKYGAIAASDKDAINHWKNMFQSNYDSTDAIVTQLAKNTPISKMETGTNIPPHQSIVDIANQQAAQYLSGNKAIFDAKITN